MALFFRKKSPTELAEQLLKELDEKMTREEKRFQDERTLQNVSNPVAETPTAKESKIVSAGTEEKSSENAKEV